LSMLDIAGSHPLTRASRSWLQFFHADCGEAADTARRVLTDPEAEPKAQIWAAAAGTAATGFLARLDEAVDLHRRGAAVASGHAAAMPWGGVEVETGLCLAYLASGTPAQAQAVARAGYRASIDSGAAMMVSGWAFYGGLAALARGHLDEAGEMLAEAQRGFEVNDTFRLRRYCLAARAGVAALLGEPNAGTLMRQADSLAHPTNLIFAPWIEAWRGWIASSRGDLPTGTACASNAADLARQHAMPAVEALALYDLARLGAPIELSRLSSLDHELPPVLARAARALAGRDRASELEHAAR